LQEETIMASEGEPRPASLQDHSSCNQEIALLRQLLEADSTFNAKLETATALHEALATEHKTMIAQNTALIAQNKAIIAEHETMTAFLEAEHKKHVEFLQLGHNLRVNNIKVAHGIVTAVLHVEIATLREELDSLRAQHTGHEDGAERESAGVLEGLYEVHDGETSQPLPPYTAR
jgi:hypothetical protein